MLFLRMIWLPASATLSTLFWIWLDRHMGWKGPQAIWPGAVLIALGLALALWISALFAFVGDGSPHPFVHKTKNLVVRGPFRVVRNPMMWGIAAILVGLCLLLGSATLWIGFAGFVVFVALFIPRYEERDMLERFGDEYREYCRQVPRWFPRLWRGAPTRAKGAGAGR